MTDNVSHAFDTSTFFCKPLIQKRILCKVESQAVDPWDLLVCELPRIAQNVTFLPSPGLRIERGQVNQVTEAVLKYLAGAEWNATAAERDDLRVAWICVLKADEGHPDPYRQAFWQYFGEQPETLVPFFAARAHLDRIYSAATVATLDRNFNFRFTPGWEKSYLAILEELTEKARFKEAA
jgi:hypothetical protein